MKDKPKLSRRDQAILRIMRDGGPARTQEGDLIVRRSAQDEPQPHATPLAIQCMENQAIRDLAKYRAAGRRGRGISRRRRANQQLRRPNTAIQPPQSTQGATA